MRESDYDGAVAEFKAAVLHGKKLAEKYPEVLAIAPVSGDSRKTAEAYQNVFVKIEADYSFAIAAEGGEDKPTGSGTVTSPP